jgi:hypothetical protein
MTGNYPGKGLAWADFLHHRHRVIDEFVAEGKSFAMIAMLLSMDAEQVEIIHNSGATDTKGVLSRERIGNAMFESITRDIRRQNKLPIGKDISRTLALYGYSSTNRVW